MFLNYLSLQKSENSDYSTFIGNLVNKRREVADQNSIKLDTVHTANGTNTLTSPTLVPTKSIIVGAGKPIVVPPNQQCMNMNDAGLLRNMLDDKIQSVNKNIVASDLITTSMIVKPQSSSSQIKSVDEFCPEDGSCLDKSFLDDMQENINKPVIGSITQDSDSDTEPSGNPLVAKFDEDYMGSSDIKTPEKKVENSTSWQRKNPLSKSRHRNSSDIEVFNILDANRSRKSSSSSSHEIKDQIETLSFNDFDSDSSKLDSKMRRSPEGIEDTSSVTPAMCTAAPSYPTITMDQLDGNHRQILDPDENEKKKKHKKKSKEHKSDKKSKDKEKKSKKKKSKEVSTSDDEPNTVAKDAYELI